MDTGKKIERKNYPRLPMPDSIVKKIEKLADRGRTKHGINFKNRH